MEEVLRAYIVCAVEERSVDSGIRGITFFTSAEERIRREGIVYACLLASVRRPGGRGTRGREMRN